MDKQFDLFGKKVDASQGKYTAKIEAPIYEPKNSKPHIFELCDTVKTKRLIDKINASAVSDEEKKFLINAAYRHLVFNYEKTADYYAHASLEMQRLMEESALIIIDFEQAIELGYVKLCESIKDQFYLEYKDEQNR